MVLWEYIPASPPLSVTDSECVFCCFFTCQPPYYQSGDSGVTVTALYPHVQIHKANYLCRLPLPRSSPAPSVSIATGQNKLLIIGQGLSWQGVFSMRFVISSSKLVYNTRGAGSRRLRVSVSGNKTLLFCLRVVLLPDAQSWEQAHSSIQLWLPNFLLCTLFICFWQVPESEMQWQFAFKQYVLSTAWCQKIKSKGQKNNRKLDTVYANPIGTQGRSIVVQFPLYKQRDVFMPGCPVQ